MRLPHGRNAQGKCDKKLDVEVIDESICCSCCLMADMQVNEQAAGAVISLTEVLNHPNVTRVVRNQWLQALNNAAKPSVTDNSEVRILLAECYHIFWRNAPTYES